MTCELKTWTFVQKKQDINQYKSKFKPTLCKNQIMQNINQLWEKYTNHTLTTNRWTCIIWAQPI